MRPLSVTAFMDGRPGHEKQTKGVLGALKILTDIQVRHEAVKEQGAIAQLKRWFGFAGTRILPGRSGRGDVDIIIGTGSRIHIPMIFHQRRHGGRLVTCMTPDRMVRSCFDLCLVPQHDASAKRANVFITVGPPVPVTDLDAHDSDRGLILVGGVDHKSHHWDSQCVLNQIQAVVDRQSKIRWTISSSPRTPDDMTRMLEQYAGGIDHVAFYSFQHTPKGWVETAYAENKMVWVTADSISMVYEALSAGCQVGILPVQWKNRKNKFQRSIDFLNEAQLIVTYDQWLEGQRSSSRAPLNEAKRCAEEILRRWWPERLPGNRNGK